MLQPNGRVVLFTADDDISYQVANAKYSVDYLSDDLEKARQSATEAKNKRTYLKTKWRNHRLEVMSALVEVKINIALKEIDFGKDFKIREELKQLYNCRKRVEIRNDRFIHVSQVDENANQFVRFISNHYVAHIVGSV